MSRLQDFQTVTPTSSDKLLVVQSQSQGLVPYGSKLDSANPTGTGKLSINRASGSAEGTNSVAVGYNTTASGNYSHAEGNGTTASGAGAHAEGSSNTASGNYAHAEGQANTASGGQAHVEGYSNEASGAVAHAEGRSTIANHWAQHVFGAYNVADASTAAATARGNYVEIVGNGASDANRSNARTLDWSGNEVLAGGLKVHGNQDAATFNLTGSIAANGTVDLTSYSDGTIIFVYRPSTSECGIYVKATTWGAVLPIVTSSIVTVNGYVLKNTGSSAIRATIIAT